MHEESDTHTLNATSDRVVIFKWVNSQNLQMGWDEAEITNRKRKSLESKWDIVIA